MAAEDYHDMFDYYDQSYYDNYYDQSYYDDTDIHSQIRNFVSKLRKANMDNNKKFQQNKFYIGSDSVFNGRNWGHPTLIKCIEHARKMMETGDKDEVFIVKIVKVIRRKKAPVEVIDIR